MWRVGGEKKGLPARIWRKIMEGKKRKKEKKCSWQAWPSQVIYCRSFIMSLGYFDFEFAKTNFFHSIFFLPLNLPMVTLWWYMRCYTMALVHVELDWGGLFLKVSSLSLSLTLCVTLSLSPSLPPLCLPQSLSLSMFPSLHLNVLITWGDAALMLTPSKKQNLLFIYLH